MKIAATGMLAALVSVNAESSKVAFSCALAASVNFIACIHYYLIWKIRAQSPVEGYSQFVLGCVPDSSSTWNAG